MGYIYVILVIVAVLVVGYLWTNGRRNSDPHNRKCAAEICELIVSQDTLEPDQIAEIFMNNARYRSQANHVLSMVPPLLISAGIPKDAAMSVAPLLREAVSRIPQ